MPHGKLLWFNDAKGHGFIATDEGERLLVERAGFSKGADISRLSGSVSGLDVTFEVDTDDPERRAVGVDFAPEDAPRRARRRRSH